MRYCLIITALFLCLSGLSLKAQAPFSHGINLTGWFQTSAPQQIQFKKYTEKDFENIKSLGCDVIRLPINLFYMTSGTPDYIVDTLFYDFLDQAVSWAEDLNMYLIIDNHSTDDVASKNPDLENTLSRVWLQMAEHYKSRSSYILYEIMNEPNGITTQTWGRIQQTAINTIRSVDTTHTIIVGAAAYNGYNDLSLLPEYTDKKLIYTFHFYDPFIFTHQGAGWPVPSLETLTRVPFPYNADSIQSLPDVLKGTWIEYAYNSYPEDGNLAKVRQLIDVAVAFKTNRQAHVYCGEYGVYNRFANETERAYWYGEVRKYLEEKGIPWTTWDYQGGFGLFKKGSQEMFNYDLDTSLVRSLGLNVPEQEIFELKPDTAGFFIYDDYIGEQITESSYTNGGNINFYFSRMPNNGKYCLHWTESGQYGTVGFNLTPNRDLSTLVSKNYALSFLVRGNAPGTKIEVRFTDTKTTVDDHPWRMNYTITDIMAPWDGRWHKVFIPLNSFVDQGSYDNGTWYNPVGDFDWSAVDKFEIVTEQGSLTNKDFFFDNIVITDIDTAQVYETAPFVFVSEITVTGENGADSIANGGTLQMQTSILPADATIQTVTWTVNDTSLAEMDAHGLLTGKKEGVVTITANSTDGSGLKGTTTVSITAVQTTSSKKIKNENNIVLYPVPVDQGKLTIARVFGTTIDIVIYNMYGQQVLFGQSDEKLISLDVSHLSQGSYIIKISDNKKVITRKFMIYEK